MALNNITLVGQAIPEFSTTALVAASANLILRGEPSKGADAAAASWTGAVVPMVDGDGSTAQRFTGIAKSSSTNTAAAAGSLQLWVPLPGYVYEAKAKTAATVDTEAEVIALFGKRVVLDLTGVTWTVDAAAADAVANCVVIIGGDFQTQTLLFSYRHSGTLLNFGISA